MSMIKAQEEIVCADTPEEFVLIGKCEEVKEVNEFLLNTIEKLKRLKVELKLDGLAAPQIGAMIRVFVLNNVVYINPNLICTSDSKITMIEKCASLPGRRYKTWRPERINFNHHYIEDGKLRPKFAATLAKDEAAMWMHEYHHLQGVTLNQFALDVTEMKKDGRE